MKGISEGPWVGYPSRLDPEGWTLTRDEVFDVLWVAPDKVAMCRVLGVGLLSDRKMDRTLKLLRKAGLLVYVGSAGGWQRTGLGDEEVQRSLGVA